VSVTPDFGPNVPIESLIVRGPLARCGDLPLTGGRDSDGRWDGTFWDGDEFVSATQIGADLYELPDGTRYDAALGVMYRTPTDNGIWRLDVNGSGAHLWYRIRCLRPSCGYAQEIPGPSLVMALDWVLARCSELAKQLELLPRVLGEGDWANWTAYPHPTMKSSEVERWILDDNGDRVVGIWAPTPTLEVEISALIGVLRKMGGPMP